MSLRWKLALSMGSLLLLIVALVSVSAYLTTDSRLRQEVDTSLEERRACLPTADQIEFVMLPKATDDQTLADWAVVAPDFRIEAENDGFWLYRRQSHDIRCVGGTLTVRP